MGSDWRAALLPANQKSGLKIFASKHNTLIWIDAKCKWMETFATWMFFYNQKYLTESIPNKKHFESADLGRHLIEEYGTVKSGAKQSQNVPEYS